MTVTELNNEFDIHYNAIASQSAPGLDLYEKSVFLTKAQLELVKNYYNPKGNKYQTGFENSEKRRKDLEQLLRNFKSNSYFLNNNSIHEDSKFFIIPNDVFLITNESAIIKNEGCYLNDRLNIKPITQDELNIQRDNPFKKPNNKVAWRLDFSEINDYKVVEIISPYNLEYNMRYIKYPKPIILGDLTTLFPSDNLSIDGYNTIQECELNEEIQREIIDRAVELALRDYKPQNLQNVVQLDQRNE
jgi:hypothetical protein